MKNCFSLFAALAASDFSPAFQRRVGHLTDSPVALATAESARNIPISGALSFVASATGLTYALAIRALKYRAKVTRRYATNLAHALMR